jgi:hypothetical protein
MSYFHRPPDTLEEHSAPEPEHYPMPEPEGDAYVPSEQELGEESGEQFYADAEPRASVGSRMTEFRSRITRALAGFDRGYVQPSSLEPGAPRAGADGYGEPQETEAFDVLGDVPESPGSAVRFPLGPLGYNRAAVDEHVAALERELDELRGQPREPEPEPAISITEEIERLGEQTASILVVAHDQAHETTRLAQEQAERCVVDAASNAVAITKEARRQLQALDMETDAIWHERARLLEDARSVGTALIALIGEAETRFPEELKSADVERPHPGE